MDARDQLVVKRWMQKRGIGMIGCDIRDGLHTGRRQQGGRVNTLCQHFRTPTLSNFVVRGVFASKSIAKGCIVVSVSDDAVLMPHTSRYAGKEVLSDSHTYYPTACAL